MTMEMRNKHAIIVFTLIIFVTVMLHLSNYHLSDHLANTDDDEDMVIFKSKPLVIWSSDFHIGPVHDLKTYLAPMGVRFIDKSLDHVRCHRTNTCEGMKTLKVITPSNGMDLNHSLIPQFYDAYRNDTEIQTVDAFACFHVTSLCELYEPFNKSLIIIATSRYELGRFDKERWTKWNENLVRYASTPRNIIGANNLYDVEYIKYFTGIQPQLFPSFCSYTNASYNPTIREFLFAKKSNAQFFKLFLKNFTDAYKQANGTFQITPLYSKYPNYKYIDIAVHQGIVYVPYQVSVMSFFEQYRMNIPLFAPSKELLIHWECHYGALIYRTYNWFSKWKGKKSAIEPHPSQRLVPDPNSRNETATRYWIDFCDYYQFPNVIYYNSISDLVDILQTITLEQLMTTSRRMRQFNVQEDKRLRKKWKKTLLSVAEHSTNQPH